MGEGTLIIGGGVVGLGIGWKLAQQGEPVTVLERGEAGREASWAAAGMLSPATEAHYQEDANLHFGRESMRLYPDFVAELEECAGLRVDYRGEGTLAVAMEADDATVLRELFSFQLEKKLPVEWLSGNELRDIEPCLSPYVSAGVLCPMDHQVDNRKLVQALKAAFAKVGGTLHENSEVTQVNCEGGAYRGVQAGGKEWRSERLLVAAGSWSNLLPGLPEEARPPVRPVKGQILALKSPSPDFLTHVIRAPKAYFAPKSDGRIVVGATVEEMGFDRTITAGGIYSLLKGAWETIPGIFELPVQEMVVGFRPGSRDNAPLLGESHIPGIFIATGHFRGGILFTPATAVYMSRLMLEGKVPEPLLPFDPRRFA